MVRPAGLLGLLGALLVAPPAAALDATKPMLSLSGFVGGGYQYRVIGKANTDRKHTRSEGAIRTRCGAETSWRGTYFIHDYASPRTAFTTPASEVVLPEGYRCYVEIAWLVGGGGAEGGAGETGMSPMTIIDTTPQRDDPRFSDDTKSLARTARDSARRVAAKFYASGDYARSGLYHAVAAAAARVALDPADPAYKKRVKVRPVAPAKVPADEFGSAAAAVDAYLAAAGNVVATGIAMVAAIDKAQGATHASKRAVRRRFERRQMLDAAGFARRYATALDTFMSRAKPAADALRASGAPAQTDTPTADEWDTARDGLIFDGAPIAFTSEIRRLHLPADLVASAPLDLASIGGLLPGTLADELDHAQSLRALGDYAAAMHRWAKAIARHPTGKPPA
jgi:hypothetical protein